MKQVFKAKRTLDGEIIVEINNPNLKGFEKIINKLANREDTDTYVSFKGFNKNMVNFEFWGADTFELAIKKETIESKVENAFLDSFELVNKEELEAYLKDIYDEKYYETIEIMLPILYKKYKKTEPKTVELFVDYSLLND
jgi:hypothetical protein